jgi:hypothetical protein
VLVAGVPYHLYRSQSAGTKTTEGTSGQSATAPAELTRGPLSSYEELSEHAELVARRNGAHPPADAAFDATAVVFDVAIMRKDQRSELLGDLAWKLAIVAALALSTAAAIFFAGRGETLGVFMVKAVTAYAGWSAYESRQEWRSIQKILRDRRSQREHAE